MWVEPNGTVKVLSGVPFNKDYENTLYFANRTAQVTYFTSKTKYTFPKVTYQRLERNYMKLEINAESLYDCNYLMYQNTSFGNRWIYAFITGVDYVANNVTRVEYEIDVIQTWFWDCTLQESYVERQHSLTDGIGKSLTPEPFDNMETIIRDKYRHGSNQIIYILFLSKIPFIDISMTDESLILNTTRRFSMYDGSGSGLYCVGYDVEDYDSSTNVYTQYTALNHVLQRYNEGWLNLSPDDIVAIIGVNKELFGISDNDIDETVFWGKHYNIDRDVFHVPALEDTFTVVMDNNFLYRNRYEGEDYTYSPYNKKLLQYPFHFLEVNDGKTQRNIFDPAYMIYRNGQGQNHASIIFKYYKQLSIDPAFMILPLDYKLEYDPNEADFPISSHVEPDYIMVGKGCINCAWISNSFITYLGQNAGILPGTSEMVGAITSLIPDEEGLIDAKGVFGGVINSIKSFSNVLHQPNRVHGNYNADIMYCTGYNDYMYIEKQIPGEIAERVDMFFQMYGYAEKNVCVPNISGRSKWNYVQTRGLNFEAPIPQDDADKIVSIFETGIRFWKNENDIGDYHQENSVPSVEVDI